MTPSLFTILTLAVTAMRATSGYSAPTGSGVPVFDGPWTGGDAPQSYICIGWSPNSETSGSLQTSPSVFGARADGLEEGSFEATLVASSGDEDPGALRPTISTRLADLQAAVYGLTDATFGGYWCQIDRLDYSASQNAGGATVTAVATFSYRVQLT